MTTKERDEMLGDAEKIYTTIQGDGITQRHWMLLRRIILALPMDEPAKVRCWRHRDGFIGASRIRWNGTQMEWLNSDGSTRPSENRLEDAERLERDGFWIPCPDEPSPQPPQPKPSMGAAVRELVRAAEDALPFVCNADKYRTIGTAIAAVKDLFVEESQ